MQDQVQCYYLNNTRILSLDPNAVLVCSQITKVVVESDTFPVALTAGIAC